MAEAEAKVKDEECRREDRAYVECTHFTVYTVVYCVPSAYQAFSVQDLKKLRVYLCMGMSAILFHHFTTRGTIPYHTLIYHDRL
jgi:hypothetical protein